MLFFNTDNMIQQQFPFPAPIMEYIFKNISASQLLKLYKTCKFFYNKFRLNVFKDFEICGEEDEERFYGNSLAIMQRNPSYTKLQNLLISKSLTYCKYDQHSLELKYEKFSRLTYKTLDMYGRMLTVKDYEFLIKPTTLRHLSIHGAIHNPESEQNLSIEECIERVPHVAAIALHRRNDPELFSPIDMKKLLCIKRQTKLTYLYLTGISKIPDPLLIIEFFKKYASTNIDYYFSFNTDDGEYNEENEKRFFKTINDGTQAWKLSLQLPPTISLSFIDLTGKTAVITGASEGIGRATVKLFRQYGASVIAAARNSFCLQSLVDECQIFENTGILHTVWTPGLFQTVDILDIFDFFQCGSKFDVFVNIPDTFGCGGVRHVDLEEKYCLDEYTIVKTYCDNLELAVSHLTEAKGCIINVPHSDGLIIKPENLASIADYKQKIKDFEEGLMSAGVRINTVNAGTNITALPRPDGMSNFGYNKYLQTFKRSHEEQVANALAFLASDSSKLINKSVLNVNPMNLR